MKGKPYKRLRQSGQFDSHLLAEIYDAYQQPLYRYIFRQVDEIETAQDLTADVFQRLLQAVQKGNAPNHNVKAWLYRTAHNLVVDYYRRQQFRDHDPLLVDLPSPALKPSQAAENNLQIDAVRSAFGGLTLEQRQVIILRFLEGLTLAEVAGIINKSTGAVKSLQHRALAALRSEIKRLEAEQVAASEPAIPTRNTKEKGTDSLEPIPATT